MPTPKVELKITARDDTRAAVSSVKQGLGSITTQLAGMRASTLKIAAAFATFRFAVAPLVNFGRAAVNAADDLLALSERTGISVEKLSLFATAAKTANTDIETVANAARLLSVRMLAAAQGSKQAAQLLGAFGVTATDSLEGALEKVLTQLGALPDGWQKSALAVKLFGRAGTALIPFANSLAEGLEQARRFNTGISTGTAQAADEFNDALAAIKASLSSTFVTALTPVLQDLTRTLNDPKVQAGLRNLAATVAGAASAIVTNFDIIKTAFAALAAVAVAMLAGRVVGAITTWITATKAAVVAAKAQQAATLAGLQATIQQTAVEKARAVALAASAQSAAANAVGSARMNAVLNSVLPAQRAAAAATVAHTAAQVGMAGAMATTGRVAGVLRGALAFLGGPIGAITTALSLGATAWLLWGNTAEAAGRKASAAVLKADQLIEQFTDSTKVAAAGGSQIGAALADLDRDAGRLSTKLEVLRRFQAQVKGDDSLQGKFRNQKIAADVADTLADIEKVRSSTEKLKKLQAQGAEPGLGALDPGALLGKLSPAGGKGASDVAGSVKQSIESAIALTQDALEREQRLLDQQLEDELISFREFYRKKTALAEAAIDVEIDAKRRELGLAKDQGDVARLTSELTILERKRGDVALDSRREQAQAEEALAQQLDDLRARLLESEGKTAEARRLQIEGEFKEMLGRLAAEGDEAGTNIVKRIIDSEVARAEFEQIEAQFEATRARVQLALDDIFSSSSAELVPKAERVARLGGVRATLQAAGAEFRQIIAREVEKLQTLDGRDAKLAAEQTQKIRERERELRLLEDRIREVDHELSQLNATFLSEFQSITFGRIVNKLDELDGALRNLGENLEDIAAGFIDHWTTAAAAFVVNGGEIEGAAEAIVQALDAVRAAQLELAKVELNRLDVEAHVRRIRDEVEDPLARENAIREARAAQARAEELARDAVTRGREEQSRVEEEFSFSGVSQNLLQAAVTEGLAATLKAGFLEVFKGVLGPLGGAFDEPGSTPLNPIFANVVNQPLPGTAVAAGGGLLDGFFNGTGPRLPEGDPAAAANQASATAQSAATSFFSSIGEFFTDGFGSLTDTLGSAISSLVSSLSGLFSGGGTGSAGSLVSLFSSIFGAFLHEGGIAGAGGVLRRVPALAFAGAPRLHEGGMLGLRSNEVPAILERGEEVLTRDDPRHQRNGGGVTVHMNVTSPDVSSFRQSKGQIATELSIALNRATRRNR